MKRLIFLAFTIISTSAFSIELKTKNYNGITLNDQPCTVEVMEVDKNSPEGSEYKYSINLHDETSGSASVYLKKDSSKNPNEKQQAVGILVMARDGMPFAISNSIENYEIRLNKNGEMSDVFFYSSKGKEIADGTKSEVVVHCKELQ